MPKIYPALLMDKSKTCACYKNSMLSLKNRFSKAEHKILEPCDANALILLPSTVRIQHPEVSFIDKKWVEVGVEPGLSCRVIFEVITKLHMSMSFAAQRLLMLPQKEGMDFLHTTGFLGVQSSF